MVENVLPYYRQVVLAGYYLQVSVGKLSSKVPMNPDLMWFKDLINIQFMFIQFFQAALKAALRFEKKMMTKKKKKKKNVGRQIFDRFRFEGGNCSRLGSKNEAPGKLEDSVLTWFG